MVPLSCVLLGDVVGDGCSLACFADVKLSQKIRRFAVSEVINYQFLQAFLHPFRHQRGFFRIVQMRFLKKIDTDRAKYKGTKEESQSSKTNSSKGLYQAQKHLL